MSFVIQLETLLKWLFVPSILLMTALYLKKDVLPTPDFYQHISWMEPQQGVTDKTEFKIYTHNQEYLVLPKYSYRLQGVIVSYHDADSFLDIWHHKVWQDFLNLRDICVIWGHNISSGIYQKINFQNDSWTCWASWLDQETGSIFNMTALSNNHLLVDNDSIAAALKSTEVGDYIELDGYLVEYANHSNGFFRGTSITRDDTGNGACETVYLSGFKVIKKANANLRKIYSVTKILVIAIFLGLFALFFITPFRVR